jgi:hypothetical protein
LRCRTRPIACASRSERRRCSAPIAALALTTLITEANNATIEKITPGGMSTVFATCVNGVTALAFDSSGNLYASGDSGTITEITPGGVQSTFASVQSGDYALAFDSSGNLFAANFNFGTITEHNSSGMGSVFLTGLTAPTGLVFAPSTAAAPEPSSLLIMGGWLGMIGAYLRLRGSSRSGSRRPSSSST